jgi:hypothetical protein
MYRLATLLVVSAAACSGGCGLADKARRLERDNAFLSGVIEGHRQAIADSPEVGPDQRVPFRSREDGTMQVLPFKLSSNAKAEVGHLRGTYRDADGNLVEDRFQYGETDRAGAPHREAVGRLTGGRHGGRAESSDRLPPPADLPPRDDDRRPFDAPVRLLPPEMPSNR